MHPDWIEHRRAQDGERIGWMRPEGDGFVVIDLLGRERSGALDWLAAEELLDELGLGYLADPYLLRLESGEERRVRITEVAVDRIRVHEDFGGAIDAPQIEYALPFPVPGTLRPLRGAH